MAVAREAKVERNVDEINIRLREPLERRAQPELIPVGVQRESGARLEDSSEVEHRRLHFARIFKTRTGFSLHRSEEHTAELQSRLHPVCRRLLREDNPGRTEA